tara:strand:+ start:6687 stop:7010 length:324 start_codon:yes stop_codon:yes gene_type:complete
MNQKELEAFARKAAKSLNTEKDLNNFSQVLTKITVEAALNAELYERLRYSKHSKSNTNNSRNDSSAKTIITDDGQFELEIPHDREGTFEPQLSKSNKLVLPPWMTRC